MAGDNTNSYDHTETTYVLIDKDFAEIKALQKRYTQAKVTLCTLQISTLELVAFECVGLSSKYSYMHKNWSCNTC